MDEGPTTEVEDIMCDQRIISLNVDIVDRNSDAFISSARIRVAVAVLAEAVYPTVLNIYYAYIRNQQTVLDSFRHQLLPSLLAFLANSISNSLSSVQRGITYPIKKSVDDNDNNNALETARNSSTEMIDEAPEKSVEIFVLSEPEESSEIKADVIFIHGLHGGMGRTWKQGEWRHEAHKLKHQTPVRCQSTGDMYVPPRKRSLKRTISEIYTNRAPIKTPRKNDEICVNNEEWDVTFPSDLSDANSDENRFEQDLEGYSDCWPRDWIQKDCPGVRVIAVNYDTDILWCPVWIKKRNRTGLIERSDEMIEKLRNIGVGKYPITWVGHSKGGLYIKQILLNTWERNYKNEDVADIRRQTKAIMFYSVPHKGSYLADCTLPFLRRSVELIEIQRNCEFVLDMHRRFLKLCNEGDLNAEVFSFIETSFTLMSFLFLKIVAYESADAGIGTNCGVPLDHREICKPAGRDCFLYIELVKLIKKTFDNNT